MTTASSPSSSTLRDVAYPALDGLRAYAALLVFLVHLLGALLTEYYRVPEAQISALSPVPGIAFMTFLADGQHGVDIFFVISGFLMSRIAHPGLGWWRFVSRRWLRIYPAFLASLVVATALFCTLYDWPFRWRDFMLNLVFYNAWPGHGIIAYNHVTWTLGYEFVFYLAVPFLAFSQARSFRILFTGMLLVGLWIWLPYPLVRIVGLLAGFLLGCVPDQRLRETASRVPVMAVLCAYCALVVAKSFLPLSFQVFYPLLLPLLLLGITCIVFGNNLLTRFFASGPLRQLGALSYSIYLFHPMVISLVIYEGLQWTGMRDNEVFSVAFVCISSTVITVLVAMVSYRLFEAPYFKKQRSRREQANRPAAPSVPAPIP